MASLARGASMSSIAVLTRPPMLTSLGLLAGITDVPRANRPTRLGRMTRLPIPGGGVGRNGKMVKPVERRQTGKW